MLQYAATKAGVHAEIYSGGQDSHGPNRTGSHRHDNGNAADMKLYVDNGGQKRYLDFGNTQDRQYFSKFVTAARAAGATGIGAGEGYMGSDRIHVGFGDEVTWGAGGSSGNAPAWLRTAFAEGRANPVPQAEVRRVAALSEQGGNTPPQTGRTPRLNG